MLAANLPAQGNGLPMPVYARSKQAALFIQAAQIVQAGSQLLVRQRPGRAGMVFPYASGTLQALFRPVPLFSAVIHCRKVQQRAGQTGRIRTKGRLASGNGLQPQRFALAVVSRFQPEMGKILHQIQS